MGKHATGAAIRQLTHATLWQQVLEARSELDFLEELLSAPAIAANPKPYAPFFAQAPLLVSGQTSVEQAQELIASLLFPGYPYLTAFTTHGK